MATTPDGQIVDTLMWRLSQLTLSPPLPVAWPMAPYEPSGGYLAPSWLPAGTDSRSIRGGSNDYNGVLQVSVFLPEKDADGEGVGPVVPAEVAGAIAAHFARGTVIQRSSTTVRIKIEKPPTVEAPVDDEPGWVHVPVSIPYRAMRA